MSDDESAPIPLPKKTGNPYHGGLPRPTGDQVWDELLCAYGEVCQRIDSYERAGMDEAIWIRPLRWRLRCIERAAEVIGELAQHKESYLQWREKAVLWRPKTAWGKRDGVV